MKSIATKIWAKFRIMDVLSNEKGFYFFLFDNDDAVRRVLEAGPWYFGGRLFVLKKWEPHMSFKKDQLTKIPIWVQFYDVPLELWNEAGLSYIASAVGKPLYAHSLAEKG